MGKPFTTIARLLRKNSTEVERLLWKHLRDKQFSGLKFKRQQPIDNKYIVDFICLEKRLVIELDGGGHAATIKEDAERDAYLIENGFKVLRFWNNEVTTNLAGVLQAISGVSAEAVLPLTPTLSREGEGTKYSARKGQIAGTTRKQIERKLGRSIVTESNFLPVAVMGEDRLKRHFLR